MLWNCAAALLVAVPFVRGLRWDQEHVGYNLNENKTAEHPRDYWGQWENHTFHPSPKNWRFPFYTVTLDRYLDGDPTNNEVNGTVFEHHWLTTHFRFGGDTQGLQNELDYLQGLGIKGLYLAGTPFLNRPWSSDMFGPLDFTLLDRHNGDIQEWRDLVTEIHRRGMYVIIDNVMATMADLIAFEGYMNETAPFSFQEHDYIWKTETRYHDFHPGNERNESCQYPRMWAQDGFPIQQDVRDQMDGCKDSEFDLYGDIKGTGSYPSHINSLSKFASVQDRLREWRPDVLEKIKRMSCIQIAMLDFDGFRMDKSVQTTVDALAEFASHQRECARKLGKENFLVVGELVTDPNLASIYVGRGKQPDQALESAEIAVTASNATDPDAFVRPFGTSALDGSAFHYDIYGALTRFLGLDGPWGSRGVDWVQQWDYMLKHNDLVNANTGEYDPRHMFGTANQDVFRWPALKNGTQRHYLGLFVTMLEMPGIPVLLWGEEQEFFILENLVDDYLYGRQPMASSSAWQVHGCYDMGQDVYTNPPFNISEACHDDAVSLDHRDPAKPMRNVLKRMFELREVYPVLNDGYNLTALSQKTYDVYLPGSQGVPSPHGIWSVYRGRSERVQDFSGNGRGNQGIWMVYSNENRSTTYEFDCGSSNVSLALISAFPAGTTVKNLFYPYEEFKLESSRIQYGIENSTEFNGCLPRLEMAAWGYKAFVPKPEWAKPRPTMTKTVPSHDERLRSTVGYGEHETVPLEIRFSTEMDCDSVTKNLEIDSTTESGDQPRLDESSIECIPVAPDLPRYAGEIPTEWVFTAKLEMVHNGVHTVTVRNASTVDGELFTNAVDRFMFRVGQSDNPMVFLKSANYSTSVLHRDPDTDSLYVSPRAAGADKFRYSTTWGSSFSKWLEYTGENVTLDPLPWSGTKEQEWTGDHVILHYWSKKTGSSDHVQHADLPGDGLPPRRFPHVFVQGDFNQYGYDNGIPSEMELQSAGLWKYDLIADLPVEVVFNVWGMNPDGKPDRSQALGDVNKDSVLDWVPPEYLSRNLVDISDPPPQGYLGYRLFLNDGTYGYHFSPVGSATIQAIVAVLLCFVPLFTAVVGILLFVQLFCRVKFNRIGLGEKGGAIASAPQRESEKNGMVRSTITRMVSSPKVAVVGTPVSPEAGATIVEMEKRQRTILVATLEYEIEDWNIKVKMGGLGVMALLMGKHLSHHKLIWVVPCLGGIDYPDDSFEYPMDVTVLGQKYEVTVRIHIERNITFLLLDAPIFRRQSKSNPYPARMDDLESAMFYSAWNQCIAQAMYRYDPDIYHINDFHGAAAQLYYLPRTIPCCLSLHNAEFQGSWSISTPKDMDEVCRVFNLRKEIVEKYVQFGGVFNLLHAGATYLKNHQRGFGTVGVSNKYGQRSKKRYPILWGLRKIGTLQNPDPEDTAARDAPVEQPGQSSSEGSIESRRRERRIEAQTWAGLTVDADAELFVFVGRWSMQKGIDIIADAFFAVLRDHPKAQLICVGPIIDLYGKFAALKLGKLAERYPGRVYVKAEFTALPPFIFSGAEFALIPSRDEPFGLVAVEFGRKGVLGVGSRVGGLGQMPGWWFTVESMTAIHMLDQFKQAIRSALATDQSTRAAMRAQALLQRFPVQQWVDDLDKLHSNAMRISHEQQHQASLGTNFLRSMTPSASGRSTPALRSGRSTPAVRSGTQTPVDGLPPPLPRQLSMRLALGASNSPLPPPLPRGESYQSLQGQLHMLAHAMEDGRPRGPGGVGADLRDGISSPSDVASFSQRDFARTAEGRDSGYDFFLDSHVNSPQVSPPTTPRLTPRSSSWHLRIFGQADTALPPSSLSQAGFPAGEGGSESVRTERGPFDYDAVTKEKSFELQKVDVVFTDSQNEFYQRFSKKLDKLDAKSSEGRLCIEEFLMQSEKTWFGRFHRAKLGLNPHDAMPTTISGVFRWAKARWQAPRPRQTSDHSSEALSAGRSSPPSTDDSEFLLGRHYQPPTGIRRVLQKKIGDWQLYCFLLAFGQIIGTNSYQITILTGEYGQATHKLYAIASVYVAATVAWWVCYRKFKALYVVTVPFAIYGLAFIFLGVGSYINKLSARYWVFNIATGLYAAASASGSLFFALNFGTDAGTPARTWAFRACVIQGTQQIYVAFLWYWGAVLNRSSQQLGPKVSSRAVTAVTVPIAILMWAVGIILFLGLPKYYRRDPENVPSFYGSLLRRKSVMVFLLMIVTQGYFLSTCYNRNWAFLWNSKHMSPGITIALVLLFFLLIWGLSLLILARRSAVHPWLIPIFAISLGAPRFAQTLWSTSGIAFYVPLLPKTPLVGAILSRSVWLWLGVLDALQGVGFGMILLQTLTRFHVAATLIIGQAVGSVVIILAKATAPNRINPSSVFPNFGLVGAEGLERPWFWVGLISQLVICVGFLKVFRKEQLFKP